VAIEVGHEATVDRLRAVDQLQGLTRAQLEEVAGLAERVQVDKGEVLAREGRIGREFFLILSGKVAVTQGGTERGRRADHRSARVRGHGRDTRVS
jgi:CRP-like cAMP-binding protein